MARWIFGLLTGLSLLVAGCTSDIFGNRDAHQPGKEIGTFHVTATRSANDCGEGALGNQSSWAFDVKLAREPGALFWNNGVEIITGVLDDDEVTFHFDSGIVMDMRGQAPGPLPPCSMGRRDEAEGVLASKDADVPSFTGALAYTFTPTEGSACDDLVDGPMPVVAKLPCGFAYELAGTRTAAPSP